MHELYTYVLYFRRDSARLALDKTSEKHEKISSLLHTEHDKNKTLQQQVKELQREIKDLVAEMKKIRKELLEGEKGKYTFICMYIHY
jgi:predicted  nucleic acid-binding Zn-ribbon protein